MEKEFDFNAIGKRTPFRTPEGFFENVQANILKRAAEEKKRRRLYRLRIGLSVALSVAAMICGIVFFTGIPAEPPVQDPQAEWLAQGTSGADAFDLYLSGLTDEELEQWMEFSENDIYYELTTENLDYDED